MQRDMKIGLVIVVIAIIIASSTLIILRLFSSPSGDDQNPPTEAFQISLINDSNTMTVTSSQIEAMDSTEAFSSFQNRYLNWGNQGTYKGVLLSDLIELIGTMGPNDAVEVKAADDYSQYYSYDNLYPNETFLEIQGQLVLAYEYNGTAPPSWSDGPRTVFLPADGGYSVDDANMTTHPSWFVGTAGGRCVKNVHSIKLLLGVYPPPIQKVQLILTPDYLLSLANTLDPSFSVGLYECVPIAFPPMNDE
ncbi:MAG: hypothetical protein ACFFDP_02980 [Promethearchaeota archaeon]